MKGNDKIAFTAEAVALFRARENSDKFSKYFVSPKIERKFKFFSWFIPSAYFKGISQRRLCLSSDLDRLVRSYAPEQIIELACGYSPRGLVMTQRNPNLVYIETDFPRVIDRKREVFKEIEKQESIKICKNHHLVHFDAIDGDLYDSLKGLLNRKKKTLVIAETLTSYLNPSEHDVLVQNIYRLLTKVDHGAYLSHEGNRMLPGFFGKLLLFYRDKVAKTRSYRHFADANEIRSYFQEKGFGSIRILDSKESFNTLYLARK
jgi:O-methyltransferase involved in polyketide biosynthesis